MPEATAAPIAQPSATPERADAFAATGAAGATAKGSGGVG
jgi:hypothetical protein